MARREVVGRYQGSVFGLAWSFFNPILMLAVYTFVFSVVFKARWTAGPDVGESRTQFAVILFAGMIVHGLLAEMMNRAPGLVLGNVNYVKKVVFPLEILPVVTALSTLFHTAISLTVLVVAFWLFHGYLHWTTLLVPMVFLPLILLGLGLSWLLASLGVFLRDVGQVVVILTTVLMFLSPVFYPLSAIPEGLQSLVMLNPLTFIIEQARAVLVFGHLPDWFGLAAYMLCALLIAWAGYFWFQRTRRGFADVL
ncbi:transport permease protein [Pseudorhodoferax aquiterrae]|uniref:Transport permease protein n=2 Tax=Pseudorhodoferax aquiterrae TaxID=747304 RepID=A0ABQ3G4H0_9BURK|nr:transport permease protein [Pseudorhodoferax aquiterrae]